MNRCEHGHYIGANDSVAYYCRLCWPDGQPPRTENVNLPRSGKPLTTADRARANIHNHSSCPACGSAIWLRVKETGTDSRRECADCGQLYTVRLSPHQQAQRIRQEVEAKCLA
jgi:Zn ribbon nucleic-acid-binding protein